jgi:hypothetical protein
MRPCLIPILLWIAIGCGDDESPPAETAASGGAGGGVGATGAAGDAGAGGAPCVGCGEFVTSSEPNLMLCKGGSKAAFEAFVSCLCEVCSAACAGRCSKPSTVPGCAACKLGAAQRECKEQHTTCLQDVR